MPTETLFNTQIFDKEISTIDKEIQTTLDLIDRTPDQSSNGGDPKIIIKENIDLDTPKVDDFARQAIAMKCGISREFPNNQLATLLGDRYAALIERRQEGAQKTLEAAEMAASIDQYIWAAMGIVANIIVTSFTGGTGTALASAAIGYLAEKSTASVDAWVARLEEQLAAGAADPEVINKIALIAGDPNAISVVVQAVDQVPKGELHPYLDNLIQQYKVYKNVVIPSYPAFIFDSSVELQIKMYSALATTSYTIQVVCDRLLEEETPMTISASGVTIAPSGSSLPSDSEGTVRGDGTGVDTNGGGGTLALLALLGLGVYALTT